MRKPTMEKTNQEHRELIGYCKECKDPIFSNDDYYKKNGDLTCDYCWRAKHGEEELNFEE